MKAFVLVSLKEGSEKDLIEELSRHPKVKNSYILFGEWDIIAELDFTTPEELGTFVMERIRSREDVRLTSSLIVAGK